MSNYPPGSMVGSGIYSYDFTAYRECDEVIELYDETGDWMGETDCGFKGDVDVNVDDYGNEAWDCPICDTQHERDAGDIRDEAREAAAEAARDDW